MKARALTIIYTILSLYRAQWKSKTESFQIQIARHKNLTRRIVVNELSLILYYIITYAFLEDGEI